MTSGFRRGVSLRYSLYLDSTQRRKANSYRRFGTSCLSHLQVSSSPRPLRMGPICWPESSVINYVSTLRTVPEHGRSERYKTVIFSHLINYLAPLSSSTVVLHPTRNRQCQYQKLTCDVLFWIYSITYQFIFPPVFKTERTVYNVHKVRRANKNKHFETIFIVAPCIL